MYKDQKGQIQDTIVTVYENSKDVAKFNAMHAFKKYWSDCTLIHIGEV